VSSDIREELVSHQLRNEAVEQVGVNYWALLPRILPPAGLAFLALLATLRFAATKSWRIAAHTGGVLCLLIGVQFAFAFVPHGTPSPRGHSRRASNQGSANTYICVHVPCG
jgi:hypothetical protein